MKIISSLFLLFSLITSCYGQDKMIVRCSIQDKTGTLWFGTIGKGIYCYTGKTFTAHFTEKEGLCNNNVYSIIIAKNGNIWFGTEDGVCYYDGKKFTRLPLPMADGGKGYSFQSKTLGNNSNSGLHANSVFSMLQDKTGNFWFGTGRGVYRYDGKSFTNYLSNGGAHAIKCISEDKKGNIWFGSWSTRGAYCFDGKSFTNFSIKEGLSDDMISCILEDKKGNIWIATRDHGVCRYDGKSFTNFSAKNGLPDNIICMLEDKKGNIWFGHEGKNGNEGKGVTRYDGKSFTNISTKEVFRNNNVVCMVEDPFGNIWLGSRFGGLCRYDGKAFTDFTVKLTTLP